MHKTIAYIRTSCDKQDLNNQKLEILEYARKKDIKIDDFIEVEASSRKTALARRIEELMARLQGYDTLVVTELSRLGRSTAEVMGLINDLIRRNVRLIVIKQGLDSKQQDMGSKVLITMFCLFAELERDLISQRTREALAAKKSQGIRIGKPKGTIQKSKFDAHVDKIKELLSLGLSVRKIAKFLGYTNHISLGQYINKRSLKIV